MPRILLVHPNHDDFLADGLLHGLRALLGADVVDFPRVDHLYADYPRERLARLHGRGFTLARLLEDVDVDRDRCLARARDGAFDLVVFTDIWRTFGLWTEWAPQLEGRRLAVVDGSDRVEPFPYAGQWWREPAWWGLPRIQGRARHLKREVTPWTWWFASFGLLPPGVARRVGRLRGMGPISFAVPAGLVVDAPPAKAKDWPAHVVDPEVAGHVGGRTGYAFEDAGAYHADLRASRFGVTVKRAGWDALRHYEIAAAGAVPCFRGLRGKPATCAPHGLVDGVNCLAYDDADELLARVAALDGAGYAALQAGALTWARESTTVVRAAAFLHACGVTA
jgi:hypothetical protein